MHKYMSNVGAWRRHLRKRLGYRRRVNKGNRRNAKLEIHRILVRPGDWRNYYGE